MKTEGISNEMIFDDIWSIQSQELTSHAFWLRILYSHPRNIAEILCGFVSYNHPGEFWPEQKLLQWIDNEHLLSQNK